MFWLGKNLIINKNKLFYWSLPFNVTLWECSILSRPSLRWGHNKNPQQFSSKVALFEILRREKHDVPSIMEKYSWRQKHWKIEAREKINLFLNFTVGWNEEVWLIESCFEFTTWHLMMMIWKLDGTEVRFVTTTFRCRRSPTSGWSRGSRRGRWGKTRPGSKPAGEVPEPTWARCSTGCCWRCRRAKFRIGRRPGFERATFASPMQRGCRDARRAPRVRRWPPVQRRFQD